MNIRGKIEAQKKEETIGVGQIGTGKGMLKMMLKDFFQTYGVVLDVYVVYSNPKKKMKSSTFAFVRYRNLDEAKRAVVEVDGRWIIGKSIRVFLSLENRNNTPNRKIMVTKVWKRSDSPKDKRFLDDKPKSDASHGDIPSNEIALTKEKIGWRSKCLVGYIKGMYNTDIVQEERKSGGFRLNVCPWHILLTVLFFDNKEEVKKAWKSRAELLHSWFDLLEKLEGFDGMWSIKIWVTLQDVQFNYGVIDVFLISVAEEYDEDQLFIDGRSPYETTGEENLIVPGTVIEQDGENDDDKVFSPENDGNDEARANGFCQEVAVGRYAWILWIEVGHRLSHSPRSQMGQDSKVVFVFEEVKGLWSADYICRYL
ncbi:hypothetical protein F3Y22_tig00006507pilonHSYRG00020 [Hibiscus syriacus]|uniref:RRM domain-containing protein n=1 Tax=Hibiscus syriacus TaxID=106335 RepID=A0A6A3CDA2_HIBSY|nr:hypothetical protein F3Y22_tig00006507pilonHSYRG00020 [Hibiscus syriacus]